jgi:hypothetical protein
MANVTSTQIILDGPRNVVVKATGVLDTSDVTNLVIVNAAALLLAPPKLKIMKINYSVSDGMMVRLAWDATTDVPILSLSGQDHIKFDKFGGLTNDSGAGRNGNILLSTTGWSGVKSYSLTIELRKQGV